MRWINQKLSDLFGLDPRSLAVLRVGLGLTLLLDISVRAMDVGAMYGGEGIVPIETSIGDAGPWGWSLHWISGALWFQWTLFALAYFFAIGTVLGWRTRPMVLCSFLLLASVQTRNQVILNGGDAMFRIMLFWAIFLPLGRVWSLDARRKARQGEPPDLKPALSVATFCFILQLCLVYWFAGTAKLNEVWLGFDPDAVWSEPAVLAKASFGGDAMIRAMDYDIYCKPLAGLMAQAPWLLRAICIGTLMLEIIGPCLLFIPFGTRWIRLVLVTSFALLHVGIELTLHVGMFSWVSLAAWAALLPAMFWDVGVAKMWARLVRRSKAVVRPIQQPPSIAWDAVLLRFVVVYLLLFLHIAVGVFWDLSWQTWVSWIVCVVALSLLFPWWTWTRGDPLDEDHPRQANGGPRRYWAGALHSFATIVCLTCIAVTLAWNFSYNFSKTKREGEKFSRRERIQRPIRRIANATCLRQRWNMFSKTITKESWIVSRAELSNGTVVDVLKGGIPFSLEKPEDLSSTYPNHRWRKLNVLLCSTEPRWKKHRRPVAEYLCRSWNASHGPDEQIVRLEFFKLTEKENMPHECTSAHCLTIYPEPMMTAEEDGASGDYPLSTWGMRRATIGRVGD